MRQRDTSFVMATVLGWAGVTGVTVCLLLRGAAPYPRWDVLACLGVVAAASLWWLCRARVRTPGRTAGTGAGRTKGWWPRRRWGWNAAAMILIFVPLLLLLMSAQDSSPRLAEIRAGDATISRAEVREVHEVTRYSTKGGTSYTSDVTVTVPGEGQEQAHRATLRTGEPLEPSDLTWALHVPDNPGAGVVLDSNAGELRSLLGDSVSARRMLVVLGLGGCAALLLLPVFRFSRPAKLTGHFGTSRGEVRRLPVTLGESAVAGTFLRRNPKSPEGRTRSELHPGILLDTAAGARPLFLDRSLDPQTVATELGRTRGEMLWAAGDSQGPADDETGTPVLVTLRDGQYLYGTVTGLSSDAGEPVPHDFALPEGLRAIGPYAVWHPRAFRPLTGGLAVTLVCAVLLATGAGSPAGYVDDLGWPLLGAGVLAPVCGLMLTARSVTRRLRALPAAPVPGGSPAG